MLTKYPNGIYASPVVGGNLIDSFSSENIFFVDGDNGSDTYDGKSPDTAKVTIQAAVTAASKDGGVVYVKAKDMAATATDPSSYAETIIIPAGSSRMAIIGVSGNRTQGGLPQIKKGSGSTALITVRAPGCLIANLGFNGASSTGGGILLDDDGGSTKSAFGTAIIGCHFKNCKGSAAAATGGAIMWTSAGNSWQVLIKSNRFYDNRAGIVLIGTGGSRPKDVVIEDNVFGSGANTTVDADIYGAGGSGFADVTIRRNTFATVDGCAYATSPTSQYYVHLTGCTGILAENTFACIGAGTSALTFGAAVAAGQGGKVPTTVRMSANYGEIGATATTGEITRT